MMEIRKIDDSLLVAPQIQPEDMPALAAQGFTGVICNRPDGEEEGQPSTEAMRAAAEEAGLAFHHVPVTGGQFPEGAVAAFRAVRKGSEGPLLGYCRTGTRAITLETLANPAGRTVEDRLQRAAKAGYDLSGLRDSLSDKT